MDYDFAFPKAEKLYESYNGVIVRVRYYVNVMINRRFDKINKEQEFIVYNVQEDPVNKSLKLDIGIEGQLHLEVEMACCKFHLKDCILAKITFLLLKIKVK